MTLEEQFEEVRKMYPGKKVGHDREWANFIARSTKPKPDQIKFKIELIVPLLVPAVEYLKRYHQWCKDNGIWCPEYCGFSVWINQGRWEADYPEFPDKHEVGMTENQKASNKAMRSSLRKTLYEDN